MARRYVCLISVLAVAVVGISTKARSQNPPRQRSFSLLHRNSPTRKVAVPSKPAKPAAQSATPSSPPRDSQAVTLANQALQSLTGGLSITDATVQGSSNFVAGSDQESGTATLEAHAGYQSRATLALSGGQRTEVYNGSGSPPQAKSSGADSVWHATPLHNCWVDPTWFFPALTIQSALNDPQISFTYVGSDNKAGASVQHIQISRVVPGQSAITTALIQRLSRVDIYLDTTTSLPVALDFNTHPAKTASIDIPVEIQYSGWHLANGLEAPSRIQKFLQGSLLLDLNSVTVSINTGIPPTDFAI